MEHKTIKMMKKILLSLFVCATTIAIAQPPTDTTKAPDFDSLLKLGDSAQPTEKALVTATFKSSRIINGHSTELTKPKHLEFRLSHRFGSVRDGLNGFFGLDNASTRIGLEYGINNHMMVGIGRSGAYGKSVDGFFKAKVLRQKEKGMPLTVTLFGSTAISTVEVNIPNYRFDSRISYTVQALIASKISEKLSLQLSPTLVHRNLVPTADYPNDLVAIGIGGRLKLSRRVSLNAEYYYRVLSADARRVDPYHNSLSIGFDIDTGGHIFSLHFTNSRPQIENGFIGETTFDWLKGDFCFGFNITRQFYLGKKDKNVGW
jgi:hypothetical protein